MRRGNSVNMVRRALAPAVPYAAVGGGLLALHNAWAAILGYHIGMVIVVLCWAPRVSARQMLRANGWRVPIIAALVGAISGILLYLLWPLLSAPSDAGSVIRGMGLTEETWPLFLWYLVIVNPWIEEYYWRGYLGSADKGPVVNDFLWAGYHLIVLWGKMDAAWLAVVFMVLAAGAWFWRQANRLGGGLLPSAFSHLAAEATIVLTIYGLLRG